MSRLLTRVVARLTGRRSPVHGKWKLGLGPHPFRREPLDRVARTSLHPTASETHPLCLPVCDALMAAATEWKMG